MLHQVVSSIGLSFSNFVSHESVMAYNVTKGFFSGWQLLFNLSSIIDQISWPLDHWSAEKHEKQHGCNGIFWPVYNDSSHGQCSFIGESSQNDPNNLILNVSHVESIFPETTYRCVLDLICTSQCSVIQQKHLEDPCPLGSLMVDEVSDWVACSKKTDMYDFYS